MKLKQQIADIILLLKTERKYQIFAALGVVAVIFLLTYQPAQRRQARNTQKQETTERKSKTTASEEAYKDLMNSIGAKVDSQGEAIVEISKALKKNETALEDSQARVAEIIKQLLQRVEDQNAIQATTEGDSVGVGSDPNLPDPIDVGGAAGGGMGADIQPVSMEPDSIESFGDLSSKEVPPPPPSEPGRIAFIGAGDSVGVKLLAGVNAPTDGTPYPVLFRLATDVSGPDGSQLPLGEARIIAAAQGSLADSRVLFRLTKMSIRLPNGRRRVVDVDGWVVGEDGLRGMPGVSIDPLGKAIGAAGIVGGLAGLGDGVERSSRKITRDYFGQTESVAKGDLGLFAGGKALSGAANEWSGILADRVRQLVPHVEVLSGREGTAIFAKSVSIKGLFEQLDEEDDVFGALN